MMINLQDTYQKALRVIDSCETNEHLKGAVTYCHLFKEQFLKFGGDETLIDVYYEDLMKEVNSKINESYTYIN